MTKTPAEVELMAEAGALLASVFAYLDEQPLAGMSTLQVNDLVEAFIVDKLRARPASKGQYGFAFALNSSRNAVVCHGVPSPDEILKDGDIVNFDITLEKHGFIADSSKTYLIGNVHAPARRLVRTTYEAMWKGIRAVRPGATLGDIGHAIQSYVEAQRCSVVRDFCGHGLGRVFHDAPNILHFGRPGQGAVLKPGMFFTVEPMVNLGKPAVKVLNDGWTAVTRDKSLSAQCEHSIGVTEDGYEVFTASPTGLFQPAILGG